MPNIKKETELRREAMQSTSDAEEIALKKRLKDTAFTTRAREGARSLLNATSADKNQVLLRIRDLIDEQKAMLFAENAKDLAAATKNNCSGAMLERLKIDDKTILSLKKALTEIAAAKDPVGEILELSQRPSGIQVGRMKVPLGVILMIYESRPNVTIDAAALCLKAGNAVILRGGKEAHHSNTALASIIQQALREIGLNENGVVFVNKPDRELLYALLGAVGEIDLAIPRGGTSLINAVNQHARIPVLQHYQGICHVYVHQDADFDMAIQIAINSKTQRPGVCNSMEGLLVDKKIAHEFLPKLATALKEKNVKLNGCERSVEICQGKVTLASVQDYATEFLDLECVLKVVDDLNEAKDFLDKYGSRHTESIITNNYTVAMDFIRSVDASCVMINASTRFNDGGELGLGAELGISTTKLHAYGPMGLDELCTQKFVVLGHGEIRS